jgi:hypothetical protein
VVDRSGLENRKGRQALGGSNPSPSAAATLVTYRTRVVTSAARSARGTQATMTPSSTLSASKRLARRSRRAPGSPESQALNASEVQGRPQHAPARLVLALTDLADHLFAPRIRGGGDRSDHAQLDPVGTTECRYTIAQ